MAEFYDRQAQAQTQEPPLASFYRRMRADPWAGPWRASEREAGAEVEAAVWMPCCVSLPSWCPSSGGGRTSLRRRRSGNQGGSCRKVREHSAGSPRQACEVGRSCDPLGSGFLRWFGGSVVREQAFGSLGLALATFANPSGLYLLVIFSERKKRRVILHGCLGPVPWLPHCPFPSLFVILCHKRQPDIAAPSLPGFGPPLSSQWDD